MTDYLTYFRRHQDEMIAFLVRLVEHESPTDEKAAIDRYGDFLGDAFRALGATVETIPQAAYGDHHRITLDPPAGASTESGQVTVLCHLDTVWALGTLAQQPISTEGSRMYGPGIYDMKGGTMLTYYALRFLRESGLATNRRVVVLLTSDEEIGSPSSRALIEEEARKSAYVLCLESPVAPEGSLNTSRKGRGDFTLTIGGRASHAGADHAAGINAITEFAHQALALAALTDYDTGTTVTVGVVRGGTRSNVVPAEAVAEIDVRVATAAEWERVAAAIHGLRPVTPGATVTVSGGLNRLPMERTPGVAALFERARDLGASFDYAVTEVPSGGGSDGQIAAALGVPTLDGLGINGDGAHARHEHILTDSIAPRAALLAALLHTL